MDDTKNIPTSKLRKGMAVFGCVNSEFGCLPRYAPPLRNTYHIISVASFDGSVCCAGSHVVTLGLPGLTLGMESETVSVRVPLDTWWVVADKKG